MSQERILVVDDEKKIVDIVTAALQSAGFAALAAYDGKEALEAAREQRPDLIVLDLMLPTVSGWDVCSLLRHESEVPIIMLTARHGVGDRINGLEMGADDYVTKPFEPRELVARVKTVLRRKDRAKTEQGFQIGDLSIDLAQHEVRRSGEVIALTPTEFLILASMAENPGHVYTRHQLMSRVQPGSTYGAYEKVIDSHIKNLRKKIEPDQEEPKYVLTVHGIGYKLKVPQDS